MGGQAQGAGSVCLGDLDGNGIDDACQCRAVDNGTPIPDCVGLCPDPADVCQLDASGINCDCLPPAPTGACCLADGSCIVTTASDCQNQGGSYQGDNTACLGDEACCLPDGSCVVVDKLCCENVMGGQAQGAGSVCLGDLDGNGIDDACDCQAVDNPFGGVDCVGLCPDPADICQLVTPTSCDCLPPAPTGACCLADGSCIVTTASDCQNQGGSYQGDNTACLGDEACCLPGGSCVVVDKLCCENVMGGQAQGAGTVCLGDGNGNGVDDACDCSADGGVQTIILRSGNGLIGGLDSAINVLAGPGGVPLSANPFTAADFAAACSSTSPANVVNPYSSWIASLASDPQAQWIAADPNRAPRSALFCYEFNVCCPDFTGATIEFAFAVDDRLGDPAGDPNPIGVYINEVPIAGFSGGNFSTETILGPVAAPSLVPGANRLHVYARDTAYIVSGLIFSATIRVNCAPEACCFADGTCQDLDPCCCTDLGGTPQGSGSVCLGDLDGNGLDDACQCRAIDNGTPIPDCVGLCPDPADVCQLDATGVNCDCLPVGPTGACCLADGSCLVTTAADCQNQGGLYQGDNTVCLGDEACCLPDGSCVVVDKLCCENVMGGQAQGPGSVCLGDLDGDGIDDACGCGIVDDPVTGPDCRGICPGPLPPIEECAVRCIHFDPSVWQSTILDCDCRNPLDCHVDTTPGVVPSCVGGCPPGWTCRETRVLYPDNTFDLCCDCRPCICGDLDESGGLVDLNDFATFAICFGQPPISPPCDCADLDADGDVDLNDFGTFAILFGSASTNSPPNCVP
jgi:hypothetical protein